MELTFTKSFDDEFAKISKGNISLKKKVIKQLSLIQHNPRHPSLRLHKLQGEDYWSISVDRSIRILIRIESRAMYVYHIGKHEDVY